MKQVRVTGFPKRTQGIRTRSQRLRFPRGVWVKDVNEETIAELEAQKGLKVEVRDNDATDEEPEGASETSEPDPEPASTGRSAGRKKTGAAGAGDETPLGGSPGDGQARETGSEE